MLKILRRITALAAVVFLAVKGFFAFISLMEASDESQDFWSEDSEDEFEEV